MPQTKPNQTKPNKTPLAQLAGAVEYTDFSAEE